MAYMEWSDKLSVGVASVDAQHKRLVSLLNELFDALKDGRGKDVLGKTLDGLINYTVTHFAYEEKLFAETGYPDAVVHKRQHDDLTKQVLEFQKRMQAGISNSLSMEMTEFLKNWLVTHIMGSDKKFGPYLVSKGIK